MPKINGVGGIEDIRYSVVELGGRAPRFRHNKIVHIYGYAHRTICSIREKVKTGVLYLLLVCSKNASSKKE